MLKLTKHHALICISLLFFHNVLPANDDLSSISSLLASHSTDHIVRRLDDAHGGGLFVFAKGLDKLQLLDAHEIRILSLMDIQSEDVLDLSQLPLDQLLIENAPNLSDISPVMGDSLISLLLRDVPKLNDIGSLSGASSLTSLQLINVGINSLEALRGLKLTNLVVSASAVESLDVLVGMPLNLLSITNTRVSDISPLKGLPLRHIELPQTVTDVSVLVDLPLQKLWISDELLARELEVLQSMETLEMINGIPVDSWIRTPRGFVVPIESLPGPMRRKIEAERRGHRGP